jgi:hypothetical protein
VTLNPTEAGAKTAVDVGVFCVGVAAGGLVDATLNLFGFAEPFVVAPLAGAGALGLKKLLWDSWRTEVPANPRATEEEAREAAFETLRAEAALIEVAGDESRAAMLRKLIEVGWRAGADSAAVRRVFDES